MKTTIDFPDELLYRAKVVAAQRKITLKDLVLRGLDYAIEHPDLLSGDPEGQRKQRGAKLLQLLGQIEMSGPVGKWSCDELYDRQDGKRE
ncbi:MAG: hypothetical protein KDN22_12010 [Verrucomicrobiae bacterium]|nr:hypothetical protein [Verrucomicrobiae bacterium]